MKSKHSSNKHIIIVLIAFITIQLNAQSLLDKRVNSLVEAMTTTEKIDQLINNSFGGTPTNSRLGIPGFVMDDGPHGVRFAADRNGRSATAFPTGIAMVATWDEAIAQQVGEAMGWEFWAFNRNQQLGPCVDICRDPRGGRSAESGGEDSYLAGHIGKSVAIGIQRTPVVATVKHFMGESKQVNRHYMNVVATDRWLMDFSGYNFRTVIQEAGVLSVMGAYNLMNGDKCCESSTMQTKILRERWGYPFYVVSDWDAIWNSDKALKAGTDICMGSNKFANDLPGMVTSGAISIADLDKAVKHVLKAKILNGMLDYFPRGTAAAAKTAEINATNLLAAQKSVILLKNEKKSDGNAILPLKKTGIKVALIGPNAMGENLNCFGSSETFPPYSISVKEGLEAKIGVSNVSYSTGCDVNSTSTTGFAAAKALAASADVVVFAGGLDATQEGEGFSTGTDRKGGSIALPGQQQALIQQLAAINPNIVVVIQSGGVCSLNNCIGSIKGLVYSFYAAQEAGTAISDVLFGDYNPAGRMPVTMPKQDSDIPAWDENTFHQFTTNLDEGYRWYDEKNIAPEFAFGSGSSYTTFSYSNLVAPTSVIAGQPFTVTVDVKNTGSLKGEEVAQLYISFPSTADVWMPKKQLRGFQRIALSAGETKTVTFQLNADDFYYWDGAQYQTQNGNFTVKIGGASDKLSLSQSISFNSGDKKPDLKITQIYTMPRYPLKGQEVSFYALVKNQGNTPTSSACVVNFKINDLKVTSSDSISTVIAPGQVQLIASKGVWKTTTIEKPELSGEVTSSTEEWSTANNVFKRAYEVFDPALDPSISNLAYRKVVTTTSDFAGNLSGSMVDGDYTSRWESARTDNESATIDLSLIAELTNISISWEAAYAKRYKIECSLDGSTWTLLKDVTTGGGGTESCAVNLVQARYVRITMLERLPINGVKYGFSIYEVVVNGNILQQFPAVTLAPVESKLYLPYAKMVLNGSQSGNPLKLEKLSYRWKQLSGPAMAQIEDSTSSVTLLKFNTVGDYEFRFSVGNETGFNYKDFTITVSNPGATTDLAFMKPTICSGVESGFTSSEMAVDGDAKTRWSSAFKDGEWWQVDAQHQIQPSSLNIVWEGAYANNFNVQISKDNKTWQPLFSNTAFAGGTSTILNNNSLSGRYFKVNCVQRATAYGSSFYSFNLNGTFINSTNHVPLANAGNDLLIVADNTSLGGALSTDADNDALTYKWEQIAGPSAVTINNATTSLARATGLKAGDYYFKLTVDDGKDVDFDIVKVICNPETAIREVSYSEIIIYPNPVHDSFHIQSIENNSVDSVQLFDVKGRMMKTLKVSSNTVSLNGIASGIYFIRLFNLGKLSKTIQIIKK
jgi:beta-glucosidase